MQNGEKLIAVESIIYEFAKGQITANNISPIEAQMIMKNVLAEFQNVCLECFVLDRVQMAPPEQAEKPKDVKHTGTVGDLKEAMGDTGFKPD